MGGWGQKMAIFDDLQYCKSSKRSKKVKKKHDDVILEWSLTQVNKSKFCLLVTVLILKKVLLLLKFGTNHETDVSCPKLTLCVLSSYQFNTVYNLKLK